MVFMKANTALSRRDFLSGITLAGAGLALTNTLPVQSANNPGKRFPIIAFSKPFQHLNYEDTADLVAEVGWDGIECPVRKGGQVLPERVEDDLPKMVEALQKRQRKLAMITTDILGVSDPLTEKVLRAASKLGTRFYRLGGFKYRADKSMPDQIKEVRAALSDLVALNRELGMCAGFQNHSGSNNIGAPVWDIYELIKDFDRKYMGICFDIGHATIEGGLAWPLHARLMEPFYSVVYAKDFVWKKGARGWEVAWCPLGEGMIHADFFKRLKKSTYAGPISQHHEHPIGTGKPMIQALKKDLETLNTWLA